MYHRRKSNILLVSFLKKIKIAGFELEKLTACIMVSSSITKSLP